MRSIDPRGITAAVAFAAVCGIVVLADTSNAGALKGLYAFPHGDKAGHAAIYGVLALLVLIAAERLLPGRIAVVGAVMALTVLIGIEELSQVWVGSRTADALDLVASYLGVATAAVVWVAFQSRSVRR